MQPIDQKILSRIYGRGRGWAFTKIDFVVEFGEVNICAVTSWIYQIIKQICRESD
jgi:hypothetical protein